MYILPRLPYNYGDLEPYIEAQIMELHHAKHHQAYVDGLNAALSKYPELYERPLITLLSNLDTIPKDIVTAVVNHGGGVENHTFFWNLMSPKGGGLPQGPLFDAIKKTFGSFEQFQDQFNTAAKSRFGSGWAWLSINAQGQLFISSTPNQETPYSQGAFPILGLDVWEHAYYLQYFNRRADYITAWWHLVNWKFAQERYEQYIK